MSKEADVYKFVFFSILGGALTFIRGLKRLKSKQHIKNIPQSKIKSAAINDLVELKCFVIENDKHITKSPLSNEECTFYVWEIEMIDSSSGEAMNWKNVFTYFSQNYLLVEDGDNVQAAIRMDQAKLRNMQPTLVKKFNDRSYKLPEEVIKILEVQKLFDTKDKSFKVLANKFRIKETVFWPGEELYILGCAHPPQYMNKRKVEDNYKFRFGSANTIRKSNRKWSQLIQTSRILKKFDQNNDGHIDEEEEKKIIKNLHEDLKKYAPKYFSEYDMKKIKIVMGESESRKQIFDDSKVIISSDEVRLNRHLFSTEWALVIFGARLFSFGTGFIILKLLKLEII